MYILECINGVINGPEPKCPDQENLEARIVGGATDLY